ncbi:cytochrome c oxidase assembly protein [Pseudalkalibacillus caeni]|uniref:cytochrome c oxidase assembly protein n=1 Tax=Exobacillus caeni TaxID=2574798 RepID=UPI0014857105|nr:cytochrome c oxidase assembly protein [Pseudalkalibacillus caeni]
MILLGFIYFKTLNKYTKSYSNAFLTVKRRKVLFAIALVFYFIAEGSPLKAYGHYLFSFHMTSMAIVYLIVPPLILLSLPKPFFDPILKKHSVKKVFSFFTFPLVSVVLFNAVFSFYHVPAIFDYLMNNMLLMNVAFYVLLLLAFLFWWPLVTPLPELNEISNLKKLGYIFAAGVLLTPACALIIFAKDILYETYLNAPRVFSVFQLLDDQQAAGIIMKIIQEIVYGTALGIIFFQWAKKEKRQDESVTSEMKVYEQRMENVKLEGK